MESTNDLREAIEAAGLPKPNTILLYEAIERLVAEWYIGEYGYMTLEAELLNSEYPYEVAISTDLQVPSEEQFDTLAEALELIKQHEHLL